MSPEAARRGTPGRGGCQRGMTLIELMIVVAVVALLGMVALPAYQGSVRKAHRAEAKAALTVNAQRLERFYTENNRYDTATVGNRATDTVFPTSENGYYALTLPSATLATTTFTLVATPQGAQANDACGSFTIDQNGTRGVSGGTLTTTDCW